MTDWPDPIAVATPAFIALVLIEMLSIRFGARGDYDWRDSFTSLTMGFGSTMAAVVFGATIVTAYAAAGDFRLLEIPVTWWSFALCFVADDFLYYWFHRSAHRVRWFWASHVVHHSSQHYNLTTALRQTWTGFVSLSFAFRLPLLLIGFPVELVLFAAAINLIYQFWIHTEVIGKLPRALEFVLNTPSHHRVHHGSNPRYLDRNYSGVFIVWDRLFDTFEPEAADEPVRYGIVRNLATFNPVWVAVHEWIAISRDLRRAPDWRSRWMAVAGPPGWAADGAGSTATAIRARWAASQRPPVPLQPAE